MGIDLFIAHSRCLCVIERERRGPKSHKTGHSTKYTFNAKTDEFDGKVLSYIVNYSLVAFYDLPLSN